MTETQPWDAKAAGKTLLADVTAAIAAERIKATTRGRTATDAEIARAVLASPALKDSVRATLDSLEDEYRPKIRAIVATEAGNLIEAASPAIRSAVAGEIARAIEESACEPGDQCAERWCTDCLRYSQSQADAAIARRVGGIT